MNYGELKTLFQDILNRDDVTTSQIDTCFKLAQTRLERILRQQPQETELTVDTSAAAVSTVPVPSNFVEMIAVVVDGYGELFPLEPGQFRSILSSDVYTPKHYTRFNSNWEFKGSIPKDAVAKILYYAKAGPIGASDVTEIAVARDHPDLCVYAALTYSADVFVDERQPLWKATFTELMNDVLSDQYDRAMKEGDNAVAQMVELSDGY